ncbi:acetyl-CoA carboxylase biotin carboxyl carrier protein [Rhodococcus sp. NPDC059968]|uniref:acetyl-CoA carboxylase biotin carboxyl carrier protein n=1 Tax=Rhodococcus sp. NPDC059968 TaxID=3347017 RepID=UPI00366C797C
MSTDTTPSWQDILDLVTQLDDGNYDTAAVEFGDVSVRLSRGGDLPAPAAAPATPTASTGPLPAPAQPVAASAPSAPAPVEVEQTPAPPTPEGTTVPAPMIGVFYRCPSPGAPPFVEPGERVEPDTTIGIIEVMKLMNPVTAGVSGTLTEILVKDNEQVEYGQPLAVVTEAGTP